MSTLKTGALMFILTVLFILMGGFIGGLGGALIALLIAAFTNIFTYWQSDKIVLKMYNAKPLQDSGYEELHYLIKKLSQRASIPVPKAYYIDSEQPNAFATGRNPKNGAVVLTKGLIKKLNTRQLAGVIAHELAHIKHRDTLIMTLSATIAGAVSMLSNFLFIFGNNNRSGGFVGILVAIFAPFVAMIVQFAVSRSREFAADHEGANIAGDAEGLAQALLAIQDSVSNEVGEFSRSSPATAHIFIINPLHVGGLKYLFTTHPPTEDRIKALRELNIPLHERVVKEDIKILNYKSSVDGLRTKENPWGCAPVVKSNNKDKISDNPWV